MSSQVPMEVMSMSNTLEHAYKADQSPSSSSAIVPDATRSSSFTKTSVRKAGRAEAKAAGNKGKVVRRTWKKPKDKPKRPLSAYNLFFQSEREKLVGVSSSDAATTPSQGNTKRRRREAHGKIGFAELARNISAKWKNLDASSRTSFEARADIERERYKREVEEWKRGKEEKEALQQHASMLLERASLVKKSLREDMPPAANMIDTNAMMANFLARTAANRSMSRQLRAATIIPDGTALHHPFGALSSATQALRAVPPPLPPSTSIGQRTISLGNAFFQTGSDNDDNFGCIAPVGVDASDCAEPDFDATLQNDLSQLEALDAILDTFKTQQQQAPNDSFHLGEDDILPFHPDERTGLQQMINTTLSSNVDDPLSLNRLIDDCLDSSHEVDRELSAFLKDGLTSSSSNLFP